MDCKTIRVRVEDYNKLKARAEKNNRSLIREFTEVMKWKK